MKAVNQRQLVTLLIMSLLVTGGVGCGNSKKGKHRAKINGVDIPQAKPDAEAEPTQEEKDAEAAKAAEAEKLQKEIDAVLASEQAVIGEGLQISSKDLPVGLYELKALATSFDYTRNETADLQGERLVTFDKGGVEITKDDKDAATGAKITGEAQDQAAGIMSDDKDAGRSLDIALGFNVIPADKGEKFSRDEKRALNAILSTQSTDKGIDNKITDLGGKSSLKASLLGLLTSKEVSQDDGGADVQTVKDGEKTIALRIYKISEKKFVAYITIDELNSEAALKVRNVYLTYELTTAGADAPKTDEQPETTDTVPSTSL